MKYASERPLANPETAARKLLDIVRASIAESKLPQVATNAAFLSAGGSVAEYSAGVARAAEMNLFRIERSGTRIEVLPDGAE